MIFPQFSESNSCTALNMEDQKPELLPEFEGSAAPPPERVTVSFELDADVLEWLKGQHLGWQDEIRSTLRFFMETSGNQQRAGSAAAPGQRGGLYP
jgi:uncharacterized protein (DUF4415 family)